jgi:cell division protein FtsI (penicillin-binding protein 3)
MLFIIIAARAVDLQVFRAGELQAAARKEWGATYAAIPSRGVIYDCKYRELAVSLDVSSIAAHPCSLKNPEGTAKTLAAALNCDPAQLEERLRAKRQFVWIRRHAGPGEVKKIRDLNLEGLSLVREKRRFYPNKEVGAQLLGLCGVDGLGLEGLELAHNSVLCGDGSKWAVVRDGRKRRIISEVPEHFDEGAGNVVLTLDLNVQYIAEQAVAEMVNKYKAKAGMAVVMDPRTGAILAMANYPQFNPNEVTGEKEDRRNRTVTDMFEPGSTAKVFLAAAAIESGLVNPDSMFFCENGAYMVGRNRVRDTHPHGWLSLSQIVKVSSNIGAMKVGEVIGPERLYETLRGFGFGQMSGVSLPGEVPGILRPASQWRRIEAGTIAFGQGLTTTCLQLAAAFSAIANDGVVMRPMMVQAVVDADGKVIETRRPEAVRRAVSPETARTVSQIMQTVIMPDGTGIRARLSGHTVCGKTGTAQKVVDGAYSGDKYISSFIGFAPAESPRITVAVVIDEPHGSHYGGVVAAPAFKRICEKTLQYLCVPPDAGETKRTAWLDTEEQA